MLPGIFQFSFGDGYAGSAKIALLSSELLAKKGYEVTLFASAGSLTEKRGREKGLNIISLDSSGSFKVLFAEISKHFERLKPGYVIAHHSLDRKVGLSLKRKFKKQFINIAYRHNITKSTPIIGALLYNLYYDYLIACGGGVTASLINSGILKRKIETIYNGVSVPANLDEISGAEVKRKHNLEGKIVLGLSTWFHKERKGFDILFKAFSQLNDNYILLLVGIPEAQQDEVKQFGREFGINPDRLIMPGYVENIWEYYKAMDIFLLPSRSEGFSLALLEAGAAGLPIIASNIPGNNEFVKHGVNGLLFNVNNPSELQQNIELMSSNETLKSKTSKNAREIVLNEYLIEHYADRLHDFLSKVKQ